LGIRQPPKMQDSIKDLQFVTKNDIDTIIDTAMHIILDEHHFFMNEVIDNSEHIPLLLSCRNFQ